MSRRLYLVPVVIAALGLAALAAVVLIGAAGAGVYRQVHP